MLRTLVLVGGILALSCAFGNAYIKVSVPLSLPFTFSQLDRGQNVRRCASPRVPWGPWRAPMKGGAVGPAAHPPPRPPAPAPLCLLQGSLQFEGVAAGGDGYSSGFGLIAQPYTTLSELTGVLLGLGCSLARLAGWSPCRVPRVQLEVDR